MTCYLDWRTEPEIDVAELVEISTFVTPPAMNRHGLRKYRIVCFVDGCNWEEVEFSEEYADNTKDYHVRWHEEGCQP